MKVTAVLFFAVLFTISPAFAKAKPKDLHSNIIGWKLCQDKANFDCIIVKEKGIKKKIAETWEELFPNTATRELVQKLNRLNIALKKGMPLAVPKDKNAVLADFSPFSKWIKAPEEKLIIFNPALLAWAAYKPTGELAKWGPAIGGMDRCIDIQRRCRTVIGTFKIIRIGDANSRSHIYPIGCGRKSKPCAPMPWFMQFEKHGYGFHASEKMEGKHASHGCVRLFLDDAKWLNQNFVELGIKVITLPYPK